MCREGRERGEGETEIIPASATKSWEAIRKKTFVVACSFKLLSPVSEPLSHLLLCHLTTRKRGCGSKRFMIEAGTHTNKRACTHLVAVREQKQILFL